MSARILLFLFGISFVLASSYDEDFAKLALIFSSIAYCPPEYVNEWSFATTQCNSDTSTFQLIESFKNETTLAFGYVGVDSTNQRVVIAFKGTNQTKDWISDIEGFVLADNCEIEGVSIGLIHKGFCQYYNSLVVMGLTDVIQSTVSSFPDYEILVTGHSLGGAAAAVCSGDLITRFGYAPTLYTFGEPRTGDYDFSLTIGEKTSGVYRVVHNRDIIPHLPPCCGDIELDGCRTDTSCLYHHTTEVWYDQNMTSYISCPSIGEDPECSYYVDFNVPDHLTYFDIEVHDYCCY
jgi:hypothetical protein